MGQLREAVEGRTDGLVVLRSRNANATCGVTSTYNIAVLEAARHILCLKERWQRPRREESWGPNRPGPQTRDLLALSSPQGYFLWPTQCLVCWLLSQMPTFKYWENLHYNPGVMKIWQHRVQIPRPDKNQLWL